jgi:PAS domain S-box-containing protein
LSTIDKIFSYQEIVLDTIKEPIFAIDSSHRFVVWNKAISDLTTLSSSQVLGQPIDSLLSFKIHDIKSKLDAGESIIDIVVANKIEFRALLDPIIKDGNVVGYNGGLYALNDGILEALPREYLVEVINASPISAIVFNLDGSIMCSNNAYRKLWKLSKEELAFVNSRYNLFLDKQLEKEELLPLIKSAFKGEIQKSPVFRYSFNSASLGRTDNDISNWLVAHIFPVRDSLGAVIYVVLNFTDVTEQYTLEEAFKESEERLQLALKGGQLGTWDWNLITDAIVYNENWAKMLGYQLAEAYQLTWENLLHPDDRDRAIKELYDMIEGRSDKYDSEFRLKTKDGQWKWILDRGRVVERSATGEAIRVTGTHIDINQRKLNEEILRESEEKYRRLLENAPIGIGVIADKKIVYVNKELARIGDIEDKDSVIGASARLFLPDDDRFEVFMDRYRLVVDKGENAPLYSTQLQSATGRIVDIEVASIPFTFEGKPAMQVLIHDISFKTKAVTEVARSRELLNQLFENSPMGIVLLDIESKVSNLNKGFEAIFGYGLHELQGNSLTDFIIAPELMEEAEQLNSSAFEGEIDFIESYRYSKSGEKVHTIIYALPVMESKKVIGIYCIYIDIGQRIKAEEELKTRNLELDNFVYKVSHDLRAPLASILGLINLTKLEETKDEQDYYIELMEGQVNKLDHFIRDILSHSKNLKMSVSSDKINFEEIVLKCFEDLSYLKATSKIVRKIEISEGEFYSDKWRINEIFRNLIGNAIKYRNPQASENFVEVTVSIDQKGCKIMVVDNGIGIEEDKLPHVLEMFYRGTESSDGSGIGLYIVQKAVEKIDGTLEIWSKINEGTKFQILLPSLGSIIKNRED